MDRYKPPSYFILTALSMTWVAYAHTRQYTLVCFRRRHHGARVVVYRFDRANHHYWYSMGKSLLYDWQLLIFSFRQKSSSTQHLIKKTWHWYWLIRRTGQYHLVCLCWMVVSHWASIFCASLLYHHHRHSVWHTAFKTGRNGDFSNRKSHRDDQQLMLKQQMFNHCH